MLCYILFYYYYFFAGGGGLVGGHVTFPCVTIIRSPWMFFHNSDNNNSFVKLQFSPFGTYASVGLENWGKQ